MNYFFGIKNKFYNSQLTIPRFNNLGKKDLSYKLYSAKVAHDEWAINEVKCKNNDNFYFVDASKIDSQIIFFLAKHEEINEHKQKSKHNLINYNNYTDCNPDYRSNLRINSIQGLGYSSYQSEYPSRMILSKGSLVSPLGLLLNKNVKYNSIFLRNIDNDPINKKYDLYLIDIENMSIKKKFEVTTNTTNCIQLYKQDIHFDYCVVSKDYLGIPIYCSEDNFGNLSFEHTHPPHENIQGQNKYDLIKKMRNEILKVIT